MSRWKMARRKAAATRADVRESMVDAMTRGTYESLVHDAEALFRIQIDNSSDERGGQSLLPRATHEDPAVGQDDESTHHWPHRRLVATSSCDLGYSSQAKPVGRGHWV